MSTKRSKTSRTWLSEVWKALAMSAADFVSSLNALTMRKSDAFVLRRRLPMKLKVSFSSRRHSLFVQRQRRCLRRITTRKESYMIGWLIFRFLIPREYMRKPHWGQNRPSGGVDRVIVLTHPSVEISSIVSEESSKPRKGMILFIYAPFFSESLQIHDKEEAKRRQTAPPLFSFCYRPYGLSPNARPHRETPRNDPDEYRPHLTLICRE